MFFLIILIFIFIFIVPLPIKLKLMVNKEDFLIYIYNIKINTKKKNVKKPKHKKSDEKSKINFDLSHIKSAIETLENNKLKPSLKLNLNLVYGLGDAAETAIFYGVISTIVPLLINLLSKFIKINCNKIDIVPEMNNNSLNLVIDSIIFISFVKVIYMALIVYKSLKNQDNLQLKHN